MIISTCNNNVNISIFFFFFYNLNDNKIELALGNKLIIYNEKNRLIVEEANKIKRLLSLKALLLLNLTKLLPLGVEINDTVLYFEPLVNKHLLIVGDYGSGIKNFFKTFILTLVFRLKDDFKLAVVDFNDELNEVKNLPNLEYPIIKKKEKVSYLLDLLTNELENRLQILESLHKDSYISLEKKEIKPIFVLINDLDLLYVDTFIDDKLLYFLKFGHKAGIHFIISKRLNKVDPKIIANVPTKLVLKIPSIEESFSLLGNNNALRLDSPGEAIMSIENRIYHLQLPFVSLSDYNKVMTKFILR